MLIKILVVLAVIIVGFIIVVAMRPSEFTITRSALIAAPPDLVFPQVNDLHNWEAWSPWAKLAPAAKSTYQGPAAGVGAVFGWSGNNNIGEGRMTIIASEPHELVGSNSNLSGRSKAQISPNSLSNPRPAKRA